MTRKTQQVPLSSINPYYTIKYSQPEAYRFSHDSVFLARQVFEFLREEIRPEWKVFDLCAGCGIVGMDFLFHCQAELGHAPQSCDFVELQPEYAEHFRLNQSRLPVPQTQLRLMQQNYRDLTSGAYDLILSNPPYFEVSRGKLSPNPFKNRCRFFMDASFEDLLDAISRVLRPTGQAFILSRNRILAEHSALRAEQIGEVRGTPLISLKKRD